MDFMKKQETIKEYDRVMRTTCVHCPVGCGMKVYIHREKIVDIWGDEEHPVNKGALCPKGLAAYHLADHPARVKFPMIRQNLKDQYKEVSWEEALDFITTRLKNTQQKHGKETLYVHSGVGSDFGHIACAMRFGRLFGTPNVMNPTSTHTSPVTMAPHYTFGYQGAGCLMNPQVEWVSSKCIFIVGTDVACTEPVAMGIILDAQERGAKLIVMDSNLTTTMTKADICLRIRPGTETSVLLAMVNLIIKEEYYTYRDLLKEDFVKRWVYGLDKWEKVCEEYTPEMVERISWVPAETIKAAAKALATHLPTQIITSSILNRNDGSVTMLRACAGMVSLLGCVGVPGGGLNLLDNTPPLRSCDDLEEVSRSEKPSVIDRLSNHGIYHAILNENPYPIKAVIWDGNPLAGMANFNRLREALHKMDLCVHLALFPNLTYHYAHAVLPMASWLENDGLVHNSVGRTLQWYNRVLDPPGQCKSFADFWAALADRFGWGDRFPWKREDYSVDARRMTDFFLKQEPLTAGCSVNLLDPEKNPPGGIFWPCVKEEDAVFEDRGAVIRGKGMLFKPGEKFPGSNKRFQTDSGKIDIASKALHDIGMNEVPTYQEPAESPVLFPELGRKYPLILTTGMPIDFIPQVGYWLSWLRNEQTNLFAQIHPRVAKLLGVSNGDLIVVENDRGEAEYPVWASETVDPRCIWCPRGADPYQPFYPYQSIEHLMGEIEGDLRRDRLQSNTAMVRVFKKGTNPQEAVDKLTGFFKAKSR